jgi:pimeloyl-ACP methyl ester carboxylesterase
MTRLRFALFLILVLVVLCAPLAGKPLRPPASDNSSSHFVSLDGSRVHYQNYGKGKQALVFVHGWTCNIGFWKAQTPAFEGKTRVILVDLPGHGQSDKPEIKYTIDLFARAVDAVLRDAGVDGAVLVGHSMGTPVIRQFYRKYPQKTLGLVIVDGPVRAFMDKKMMDEFIAALRGPDYKTQASGFVDGIIGPQVSPQLRDEIKKAMLSAPQYVAVSAMEAMTDESIWKEDKINVPVLAVLAKSPFWPADTEQFFRSLAPRLDYQMWEGVGHFLMMEKPQKFNEAVAAFLTSNQLLAK